MRTKMKIKDWISKEQDGLMDAQGNFEYPEHEGAYHILCNLDAYIDSLQEEPASEDVDLDDELRKYLTEHFNVYKDGILQSKRSNFPLDTYDVIKIAMHFFELGLKAQKGE